MFEMQAIATDVSVCLSGGFIRLWCAKTAEGIEVPFGMKTPGGPRNAVLEGDPDPPTAMQLLSNHFGRLVQSEITCYAVLSGT